MAYSKENGPYYPQETSTTEMYKESLRRLKRFVHQDVSKIEDVGLVFDGIGESLQTLIARNSTAEGGVINPFVDRGYQFSAITARAMDDFVVINRFSGPAEKRVLYASVIIPRSSALLDNGARFGASEFLGADVTQSVNETSITSNPQDRRYYLRMMQLGIRNLLKTHIPPTEDHHLFPLEVSTQRNNSKPFIPRKKP